MCQQQYSLLDVLTIVSFFVGVENLMENRQQSAQNDVNIANDRQAKFLLRALSAKFDEQNEMLKTIMEAVNEKPN
jgi:hypothetical protein